MNGIATFNNLIINAVGNYTLTASDGTLTGATSQSFPVFGVAAKLGFMQQPTNTATGVAISPAVTVAVQDANGSTVGTNNSTVTLTLGGGTFAGGSNTASVAAVNGIATFSNLIINAAGNYTLTAGNGALTGAVSQSFTISVVAAKLARIFHPSS